MSKTRKDNSRMNKVPGVISNANELSGIRVGSQMDILWPFHAYEICLPAEKNKPLNIFEETILKLIGNGINDITDLHEEACMDKEIIEFIRSKLIDHGLLGERNEITDRGKELIGQWDEEQIDNNYVSAHIIFLHFCFYCDLISNNGYRIQKYRTFGTFFNFRFYNYFMFIHNDRCRIFGNDNANCLCRSCCCFISLCGYDVKYY